MISGQLTVLATGRPCPHQLVAQTGTLCRLDGARASMKPLSVDGAMMCVAWKMAGRLVCKLAYKTS